MKRTLTTLFSVFILIPLLSVVAQDRNRGYVALRAPQPVETGERIEVREFFWYGCPHCYSLEPAVERWLKRKPPNVAFVRTPATSPRWLIHAQAYYAFEALGALERTHAALFRAMHEQNRRLGDETALAEFAAEQGIDPAKFRAAFNSFGVRTKVEKAKQINAAYQVTSVPMFAVDGKYVTSAAMTGGEAGLLAALDQLVQKAARERPAKPNGGK